MEIYYDSWW